MSESHETVTGAPAARGPSVRARFGTGVLLNLVAVLFNQGSTLLTNMVLANLLGSSTFGRYVIIASTLQSLSAFAGLGMGFTATRYLPEHRASDPARAQRILGLCALSTVLAGTLVAVLLVALAPLLADRALHAAALAPLLRLGAAVVLCTALNGYFTGVLAGLERYQAVARAGVISGTLYIALCVTGAKVGGLPGAVVGLSVSAITQSLVLGYLYARSLQREGLAPNYRAMGAERAILSRWVVPGLLSGLTAIPALWLAQVALARAPGGFAELARYAAAYSLSMIVLFLPNVAYNVGMSLINHARGTRSSSDYRDVFWTNLQFTGAVTLLGVLGIGVAGPLLLGAYGTSFKSAYPVLLILLGATIPESLTIAMYQLIQSNDRIWASLLLINIPRDLLIPSLAVALAPSYGAAGVALAYLGGRLLACLASALLCRRIGLTIQPPDRAPAARPFDVASASGGA